MCVQSTCVASVCVCVCVCVCVMNTSLILIQDNNKLFLDFLNNGRVYVVVLLLVVCFLDSYLS